MYLGIDVYTSKGPHGDPTRVAPIIKTLEINLPAVCSLITSVKLESNFGLLFTNLFFDH